jgi:RNA polymerase sigma factor (sigma-70 family)
VTEPADAGRAVAEAHRREWAVVLAAVACAVGDLELAEDCVQEAYASALQTWATAGVPANPAAWLTTTARRRAIDAIRREHTLRAKMPLLAEPGGPDGLGGPGGPDGTGAEATLVGAAGASRDAAEILDVAGVIPDERLRLIFMCCHPALAAEAQMALTLRLVCGMATADIARAFLVAETTMGARLTRAKKKIATARIAFLVPGAAELPDRLQGVLGVIYLLFTTGHTAPSGGPAQRPALMEQALRLTRMLRELMPDEAEVGGLLALLLVSWARRATRADAAGRLVPLAEQDRSQWDRRAIAEAHGLVVAGLRGGRPGRYVLQAAIASLHAEAPAYAGTDWPQIVRLYDELLTVWPSPVVALNRAVALSMTAGPAVALAEVERLAADGRLAGYHYLPAVQADLLRRLGRTAEAAQAGQEALRLTANAAERDFLAAQEAAGEEGD